MSDWELNGNDLETIYGLHVSAVVGGGLHPLTVHVDEYAALPGGEYKGDKIHPHHITLIGVLNGTSRANLHVQRRALLAVLTTGDSVTLTYTGATVDKEIQVRYEGGLEVNFNTSDPCFWERVALNFLAADPFWYAEGSESDTLNSVDSATFRWVAARIDGQWNPMGPPTSGGAPNAVARGPDGKIYIGGDFTNWNGNDDSDYIVVYDPETETYAPLGGGLNHIVWNLGFGPDGWLYVVGEFTDAGGDGNADYVAKIDVTAETPAWTNVHGGPGGVGAITGIYCFAFDHENNLYLGGDFTNWGGVGANYLVMWDNSAWDQVGGVNPNSTVWCITVGPDGRVYFGGGFATVGATFVGRIAVWDGSDFDDLGGGANGMVLAIAFDERGYLYAGGSFTIIGSVESRLIARWDETVWEEMAGGGTGNWVWRIVVAPDNLLYVVGDLSTMGGVTAHNGIVVWNGTCFYNVDWRNSGGVIRGIALGEPDGDNNSIYDVWIGHDENGTTYYFDGLTTVANDGTAETYPIITISRDGGSGAILCHVGNETTGVRAYFNYSLLDGETLTIDLTPGSKSIESSLFGTRLSAFDSNIANLNLQPGNNVISLFVFPQGGPTVTGGIEWTERFRSLD